MLIKKIILLVVLVISVFLYIERPDASDPVISWGIPRSQDEEVPYPGDKYHSIITKNNGFYLGDTNKKNIYLTFDTGYAHDYTKEILDILDSHNIKGTFFVTGGFIKNNPELILRMYKNGHIVGNHTYTHPHITQIDYEQFNNELTQVEYLYEDVTGVDMLKIFRPPGGVFNEDKLKYLRDKNYVTIFWSLAYVDYLAPRGPQYTHDLIIDRIHPGAIILMHTKSKDNLNALSDIIQDLREMGYEFYPVTDIFIENM